MGYSSDSDRPAKRLKPSRPHRRQQPTPTSVSPTSTAPLAMPHDSVFDAWIPPTSPGGLSEAPPLLGYQPTWQPTSFQLPPSRLFHDFQSSESQGGWTVSMPSVTIGQCFQHPLPCITLIPLYHIVALSFATSHSRPVNPTYALALSQPPGNQRKEIRQRVGTTE